MRTTKFPGAAPRASARGTFVATLYLEYGSQIVSGEQHLAAYTADWWPKKRNFYAS